MGGIILLIAHRTSDVNICIGNMVKISALKDFTRCTRERSEKLSQISFAYLLENPSLKHRLSNNNMLRSRQVDQNNCLITAQSTYLFSFLANQGLDINVLISASNNKTVD